MKLLLTSNGITNPILEKAFQDLIGHRKNLKVALIPTASDPIQWVPEKPGSKHMIAKYVGPKKRKKGEMYYWFKKKGFKAIIADLKDERKKYLKTIIKYPWKVYLVKDGQAIKVDGDKIEHIGPGIKKSI